MRKNPYANLCLSVQALRRDFEGIRTPLAPATGVASTVYTHQIANVFRVLTDVRVRHLLADEVGLGKTVQALMILNALRYQRPDLRALVVVPQGLVTQWRNEIMARAHSTPVETEEGFEDEQYIRLAWETQLGARTADGRTVWSLSDIDPSRYQTLVVDELHSLRADVQDRIVRVAGAFEHVLALTATPAFQNMKRHAQLFALLEPERSAIIGTKAVRPDVDTIEADMEDYSNWTEQAAKAIVDGMLARDENAESSCSPTDKTPVALAHCAYRRVIRTRRADYAGVLPRRRHMPHLVEPLEAEVERQSLMWGYIGRLGTVGRRVDPVPLAKRVVLSPPSLRERIGELIRADLDREGLLEAVRPLADRNRGDSRADELVDLLAEVWTRHPEERVLVAVQDNPTVDYLFELVQARLPMVGPLHGRAPLVAARIRQMAEAVSDLGGYGNETVENLEAFQRGEAQILIAPETAREGHNLQCARILVLYSVPWRPEEVEQWIGRLDRIGNKAAFPSEGGAGTIDIHTIVQKGQVDEMVVAVLRRFGAFERGVNLDGEHLEEVAQRIEDAALRPTLANWSGLEEETEAMAKEDAFVELNSALRPYLPWNAQQAALLRRHLDGLPPGLPALASRGAAGGPRSWDRAVEGLLHLLDRANEYHFRWNEDPAVGRFRTLWYRYGEGVEFGRKKIASKVLFSTDPNPERDRHPKNAHAFVTRRDDIGSSPHPSVSLDIGGEKHRRPFRFFCFGNLLHDELINGWLPEPQPVAGGIPSPMCADVLLPADHKFFESGVPGIYFLRMSRLDPASALDAAAIKSGTLKTMAASVCTLPPERSAALVEGFQRALACALEADVRWLRGQLTAELFLEGVRCDKNRSERLADHAVCALVNPMAHGGKAIPRAAEWRPERGLAGAASLALASLRMVDNDAARCWSNRFPEFDDALSARLRVVGEETRDAEALARLELAKAEAILKRAQVRGNRGQITRAVNQRKEVAAAAEMTRVMWASRNGWLKGCGAAVRGVQAEERLTAMLRVQTAG